MPSPALEWLVRHIRRAIFWGCIALLTISAVLLQPQPVSAQGGPPMRTDDPCTPGNGNWEINSGLTTDRRAKARSFEAPVMDINYGFGNRLESNFEIPWVVRGTDTEPTRKGLGNSGVAVKWRFL